MEGYDTFYGSLVREDCFRLREADWALGAVVLEVTPFDCLDSLTWEDLKDLSRFWEFDLGPSGRALED
jgi:hypothetical protein